MVVFDTDAWGAGDRVEWRRAEVRRSVIGAEVVTQGERPHDLAVRMSLLRGGSPDAPDIHMGTIRKMRDHAWSGDGADDLTFMLCLSGNVRFDANGERHVLRRGEATLFSPVVPVDLVWEEARVVTIQVPRAALAGLPDLDRLAGRLLGRDDAAVSMLGVYLAELSRQGAALTPRAERHLLDLIVESLTGGATSPIVPRRRAARRLAAVRAIIRTHAIDNLKVDQVAAAIGVSVRTIERDFATDRTCFADELTAARLDLAMEQLGDADRIGDLAFAVGFNDLSCFNRHFKARFGRTPTEERAAMRRRQ